MVSYLAYISSAGVMTVLLFASCSRKEQQVLDRQDAVEMKCENIGYFISSTGLPTAASEDGMHVAQCVTGKDGRKYMVLDGQETSYLNDAREILDFVLSPDGKRLAYSAKLGDSQFVAVDGRDGRKYARIGQGSLVFSPDGKRLAYAALHDGKQFVVVNGNEGPAFDVIHVSGILFSDDGMRFAYLAARGDKSVVVLDNQVGPEYDAVVRGTVLFSPSGERFAYAARRGDKSFLVIDGHEGPEHHKIISGQFFNEIDAVEYLAEDYDIQEGWSLIRCVEVPGQ